MAARVRMARDLAPHIRASLANPLALLHRVVARSSERVMTAVATRPTRAHLAMLGLPLAITAALMAGQVWAVLPLTGCAWWWAPCSWGWEWLDAVGRGVIATEWAYLGAGALGTFPDHRLAIGLIWRALPIALAMGASIGARVGEQSAQPFCGRHRRS
jgi:hypothetical protein